MNKTNPLAFVSAWLGILLLTTPAGLVAQPAGTIVGQISNPVSGEYILNAQVRIEGQAESAVSGDGGWYHLSRIAPGEVTLAVSYSGYRSISRKVDVRPGATAVQHFELVSTLSNAGDANAPVQLGAYVVSSEREGNAKAIMQQRNSMDITNVVASDIFGDVSEGNVGEFLKHMPGVEQDLISGDVRTIRLRGLDAEYTQVTMDGISLASADANAGAAGNARAFSFEQVSLAAVESIEVSKTISADVDASAPAGTINLKSKRAFNQQGRRVSLQADLTAFSASFNLERSWGPGDHRSRKVLPGGIFSYSDVFFKNRLGINFNISESNLYSAHGRATVTYNYTPTAADPRPVVPTTLSFLNVPRSNRRSTVNLTGDFKATPRLVLSLGLLYNYQDLSSLQRTINFNLGARGTVVGPDPSISLSTSAANTSFSTSANHIAKQGQTLTATPRFEYKVGDLTIEGKFGASNSTSWYNPIGHLGVVRSVGTTTVSGVAYTAERSSLNSADWKIVQTRGPDIDNGANFANEAIASVNDGRYARTDVFSGEITGALRTSKFLPVVWKAGIKRKFEQRDFRLERENHLYTYVGPGAGSRGQWANYRSGYEYDMGMTNTSASVRSVSGGTVWLPDNARIGGLFLERPEYFAKAMTPTNYYNAFVVNRRYYEEEIDAAFLMATATAKRIIVRVGLRGEETKTAAVEFDPRSAAELSAAGFPHAGGLATTIPGLEYQFFSQPKIRRIGNYDNLFPSASLKYKFSDNFDLQLGFSSTIRRPTFRDLAGVWVINDEALTVNAPNPALKPERSKNISARLAYYFEPVGIFAINAFQNNVRSLFASNRITAREFGYTGTELADYEFITTTQSDSEVLVRGMEYEYSQSLSFLPGIFRGFNVRASYTRNYAELRTVGMIPHSVNAGVSYANRRFSANVNVNWRDDYPLSTSTTTLRYQRARTNMDIGANVRLSERTRFFFSARNILNDPYLDMEQVRDNPEAARVYSANGTNWTFGLKVTM